MTKQELFHLALGCSEVKPKTIAKHFQIQDSVSSRPIVERVIQDDTLLRKVLGFCLSCSTGKYGISKKKLTPRGCPHLLIWGDLVAGNADIQEYEEVFAFLSQCPQKKKKQPVKVEAKLKSPSLYMSKDERKKSVEQEKHRIERNREIERIQWKIETREERARIRFSLTPQKMRSIYLNLKKENKMTTDRLCIKSNTSRYAIEAIETGTMFDTYTAARLSYFIMTNNDIDHSEYKNEPIELFVDLLAGKKFRYKNNVNMSPNKPVDNPKACNIPLYLKK